jgi:hypothetical protein
VMLHPRHVQSLDRNFGCEGSALQVFCRKKTWWQIFLSRHCTLYMVMFHT